MKRSDLLEAIGRGGRELSATTIMFHTAIAEHLGLGATDHKVLDFVLRMGPSTAGQLAEITGLTTGAITGVIDRLEAAGYVKRVRDAKDRRKVLVHSTLGATGERRLTQLFASLAQGVMKLASSYNDEELAAIVDYLTRVEALMREETAKLKSRQAATSVRARR
ncbi:MAG: MarR family winged helix-turn-helix transcriptional regulator [Gemmatimonadaceae bacterium]